MKVAESTFWTDSMATIHYIDNTERRFHALVANRVTKVCKQSKPEHWRHVPSTLNPADDTSRGLQGNSLNQSCRWMQGPAFLLQDKDDWPRHPATYPDISADNPEVKKETINP